MFRQIILVMSITRFTQECQNRNPNLSLRFSRNNLSLSDVCCSRKRPMHRPIRIALKAIAIYAVVSLAVGIVMAELTLHPVQRRPPDTARIARRYAQSGAELQAVSIHAADGAELRAWYSVPARDNGKAIILLHGIGDNRGGVAGYGQMFLQQGYRVLLPDRVLMVNLAVVWRPMVCVKMMIFIVGFRGSMIGAQLALTALANPWARR